MKNKSKPSKPKKSDSSSTKHASNASKPAESTEHDVLMEEIIKMGGSKDDWDLVQGCPASDDDQDLTFDAKDSDAKLANELQSFIKNLGFDKTKAADDDDEDDANPAEEFFDQLKKDPKAFDQDINEYKKEKEKQKNVAKEKEPVSKRDQKPTKVQERKNIGPIQTHTKMMIEPKTPWFELSNPSIELFQTVLSMKTQEEPTKNNLLRAADLSKRQGQLIETAKNLLQCEQDLYTASLKKAKASSHLLDKMLHGGTFNDKIAALSMAVSASPVHTLNHLSQLMNLVRSKARREALAAISSAHDLFMTIVPDDRKLKFLREQEPVLALLKCSSVNLSAEEVKKRWSNEMKIGLMRWYIEDQIKTMFFDMIVVLEQLSHDPVYTIKAKMVTHGFQLLAAKKEQERTLLTFLVNKVGDQERKLASKVAFLLQQLLEQHPMMKLVVMKEIERLIRRPGITSKAQYYAIVVLNQTVFTNSPSDIEVAQYLVHLYFNLFELFLKGTEQLEPKSKKMKQLVLPSFANAGIEGKMLSGILAGLSRAFPFAIAQADSKEPNMAFLETMSEHFNTLFRLGHLQSVPFTTSVQALQLVFLAVNASQNADLSTRFYRALFALISSPRLHVATKSHALFLNLVYKAVMNDTSAPRTLAILRRLVQCSMAGANAAGGGSVALLCGSLVVLSEVNKKRAKDEVYQRLYEACVFKGVEKTRAENAPEMSIALENMLNESDDEEHFVDVDDDDEEDENKLKESDSTEKKDLKPKKSSMRGDDLSYDPLARSPEFARAGRCSFWELSVLTSHFHPTVSLFAKTVLNPSMKIINYPSDPLSDFTLIRFLDRFSYKNPKQKVREGKIQKTDGQSSITRTSLLMTRSRHGPVNEKEWRENAVSGGNVPVDERFYATYFKIHDKLNPTTKEDVKEKGNEEDLEFINDAESVDGHESLDDEEIHEAIMACAPENSKVPDDLDDEDIDDEDMEELMKDVPDFESENEEDGIMDGEDDFSEEGSEDEDLSDDFSDDNIFDDDDSNDSEEEKADKKAKKKEAKEAIRSKLNKKKGQTVSENQLDLQAMLDAEKALLTSSSAESSKKKKKAKGEVMFASVDDYAHLLELPGGKQWWEEGAQEEYVVEGTEERPYKKRSRHGSHHNNKQKRRKN